MLTRFTAQIKQRSTKAALKLDLLIAQITSDGRIKNTLQNIHMIYVFLT